MGAEPGPGVRIGVDDWVAEAAARTQVRAGPLGQLRGAVDRVGPGWRLAVLVAAVAAVPVLGGSQLVIRIGINALLFALLALGLNVIVGEAGLLDLGYIAFYGFGAYGYALLSSNQFHLHWPSELTILLVTVATAGLGVQAAQRHRRAQWHLRGRPHAHRAGPPDQPGGLPLPAARPAGGGAGGDPPAGRLAHRPRLARCARTRPPPSRAASRCAG